MQLSCNSANWKHVRFSGSIAEAIVGKAQLKKLRAGFNRLSGALPDGLTLSRSVTIFQVQEKRAVGKASSFALSCVMRLVCQTLSTHTPLIKEVEVTPLIKGAVLKKTL